MKDTIQIRNEKREELYKVVNGLDMHEIRILFEQVIAEAEFNAIYKKRK